MESRHHRYPKMMKGRSRISHDSTSAPKEDPERSEVMATFAFTNSSRKACPAWGGMAVV